MLRVRLMQHLYLPTPYTDCMGYTYVWMRMNMMESVRTVCIICISKWYLYVLYVLALASTDAVTTPQTTSVKQGALNLGKL